MGEESATSLQTSAIAARISGAIDCPQCQRTNPPDRRFCSGCGQPLYQNCPKCRAECPIGERFCGACGADINAEVSDLAAEHQATFDRALARAAAHQYDEALESLRSVAAVTDRRFQSLAQRATAEISRWTSVQEQQAAAAADALTRGRALYDNQAYEQCQATLEKTPHLLRTDEHQALLDQACACRREVLELSGEIREATSQKRFGELLPKLARLLALMPRHAQARQLAEQLSEKLLASAKVRLSRHQYQEALDQLDRIPPVVRTPQADELYERASELYSLLSELQMAALADQNLLALAERLCQLAPDFPTAAKLRAQIVERAKTTPAETVLAAPNWAPIPQQLRLGAPVDALAYLTAVPATNANVERTLRDHPGQFFVAFGLALQAIGEAALDIDLSPRPAGKLLDKLSLLNMGKRPPTAAWGLDLSDTALKAIKLVREGKEGTLKIEAAEFILHTQPLHTPAAEQHRGTITAATLQAWLERAGELKLVKLCASVAGSRVLGRFCELPPMPARKVLEAVQYEARHQLPVALDSLCWSHAVLGGAAKATDDQPRRIVIQAIRDSHVQDRIMAFKSLGLAIDAVQSECLALHNAMVYQFRTPTTDEPAAAIAAVDVGVDSTNVVVSSRHSVWFRTFAHGGDAYARALTKALELTTDQAQSLKREPARAASYFKVQAAWQPLFVQLASEIERSLATHSKLFPEIPVGRIFGLGGGFATHGLLRHLRTGR